nr:IPTL-CTERM sorting domain-containing protein [Acidovorax sp. ACV01]
MSVDAVTLGTPLAAGASIDVRFLLGIQQAGSYRLGIVIEGLPQGGGVFEVVGCTDGCPLVQSIVRADADPTVAASVNYTVTFTTPVTGVDASDFVLTSTGTIAGASVTGVSGAGAVYTVTVNTGTGSGTLRLDVNDDNTINAGGSLLGGPTVGDGNFTTGAFYTITRGVGPVSNIPTLSEYAMMLLGLALMGSVWLQRKRGNLR